MSVSKLDAWTAAPIFLGVAILFGVPVSVGVVAIATTKFVEKEGKRERETPADITGFSRTYGAKQGADTEKENQNFFHRGADLGE
jgi:hypothetical protein